MTTTLSKTPAKDNCLTVSGISWTQLEMLETAFAEIAGVRLVYLDSILEIMTLSPEHEEYKCTFRALVEAYLRENKIRFYMKGSPTLGSEEKKAKKEPDESYNIGTKKETPDLALEVVFTSGGINKLELYQRLEVPEVWFWEDGVLSLYHLRDNGYERINRSELLPDLDIELLSRYITYHDQYDAVEEFTQILRDS
ncbi:MAG: Uma2 family endonuclease [Cyanobacteriota bacterium]|nr:Uma2 family endonuclease [Cyanobacteriota bacterium]